MSKKRTKWNSYTVAFLGVMIAVTVVMTRLFKIDLGFARFNLGSAFPIMAGLWAGPVCGGLTGLLADLIGSFLQGYAPNPLITLSAAAWGIIPALLFRSRIRGKGRNVVLLCASIFLTSLVCTMGLTYAGLVMIGYDYRAIFMTRLVQFSVMTPVYCVLVCCLYFSPVTSFLTRSMSLRGARQPAERRNAAF